MFKQSIKDNISDFLIAVFCALALGYYFFMKPALQPFYFDPIFIAALLGALPNFAAAIESILKLKISIDVFNSVALTVSLVTGQFISAVFIVLMLAFARFLGRHTEKKSKREISDLLKLKRQKVIIEKKGLLEEVFVEQIKVGDTVLVASGGVIPVDGKIIKGETSVNQAPITGESMLIGKIEGDMVYSASINEGNPIKIIAKKVGKDSTIERVISLVGEARKKKSKVEKIADRFALIFLPIVIILAIVVYLFTKNIAMVVALLLIVCADDIAVATPLAITASIGRAAKSGVVIKGGEFIQNLAKLDTLVFDKTGTLTYGAPKIDKINFLHPMPSDEFWKLVGIAEKYSEHPIGRFLFKEAWHRASLIPEPDSVSVVKGKGIIADYKKDKIIIGNFDFLKTQKLIGDEKSEAIFTGITTSATNIYVAKNNEILGILSILDTPRAGAKRNLEELRNLGVKNFIMLTGDNKEIASVVASRLGIENVEANLMPEEKFRKIETLIGYKKIVGMVGDGVNDAPALARADVGIAMGAIGTDAAIESADVVLMGDDLGKLPKVVKFGKITLGVIRNNFWIWGLTNVLGLVLVFAGVATPAFAAFYNFITDFLPLINSARIFRFKL